MARRFGNQRRAEHAGELRQSQLTSTFGVGSIIDFVDDTVIIAGIDNWDSADNWKERRLFNNGLQAITGVEFFLSPQVADSNAPYARTHDVEAHIFPQKLYCPICKRIIDAAELRNQKNKYNCFMPSISKPKEICGGRLVAARFVIVCPNGHMEDFPYSWWVHHGGNCEKRENPQILMYNVDNRSDINSLVVECEDCQRKRSMSLAFSRSAFAGEYGYGCGGKHPHLGRNYTSECGQVMTARLRSSSSIYFPATLSALTIPPWSRKAVQVIEKEYKAISDLAVHGEEVVIGYIKSKLIGPGSPMTVSDLLSAYKLVKEQKSSSKMQSQADIFAAEYDVLCRGIANEDEYIATEAKVPAGFEEIFDSITVIDKLTEINVLAGFTRVSPWDGSLASDRLALLAKEKKNWLPAVKLLGEGIFFKFNQGTLANWAKIVGNRYSEMENELRESFLRNDRFSPQYIALHTFAHLLIRQLANDCGYSTSSIKEKIYSTYMDEKDRPNMCGILVYLATPDAEGSLGGLISIANDVEKLQSILKNMLRKASWCSADPFCRTSRQGFHSLNYAACHDCVLLPETSCEFRNVLLDRISIVGKPENPDLGLMGKIALSSMEHR